MNETIVVKILKTKRKTILNPKIARSIVIKHATAIITIKVIKITVMKDRLAEKSIIKLRTETLTIIVLATTVLAPRVLIDVVINILVHQVLTLPLTLTPALAMNTMVLIQASEDLKTQ